MKEAKELVGIHYLAEQLEVSTVTVTNYINAGDVAPEFVMRRPNGGVAAYLWSKPAADKAVTKLDGLIRYRVRQPMTA
jgi:hypothetical protein